MKRFLLSAFALILALPGAAFAQGMKIGTLDMDRLFKEHPKTKEAEVRFNETRDAAKKEYEDKAEAYKKALEDINRIKLQLDAPALSAEAKSQKAKEREDKIVSLRTMEQGIDQFRQSREQQFQQDVMKVRQEILKEITDIVMEKVKAENYDYVFDKTGQSTNGFSPVLYSREEVDFTANIVEALRKAPRPSSSVPKSATATATPAKAASPAKAATPASSPKPKP